MKLSISQVAEATAGTLIAPESKAGALNVFAEYYADEQDEGARASEAPPSAYEVNGFSWDSRTVRPGWLYVALAGERFDGHDFVEAAVLAGAHAVMVSKPVEVSVPAVLVDDTIQALSDLAAYWRSVLQGRVIGLTGSNGKTTTKNLVRDVLASAGSVVATEANQNNELGVPRTLLAADADTKSVVVEMGMRGLGQIAELSECARPDWGLITNVGESHMELLGSRDNIARAKSELFEALPDERGIAFVNAADDYAQAVCSMARLQQRGIRIVLFGSDSEYADSDFEQLSRSRVWASDVSFDAQGRPSFTMNAVGFEEIGLDQADGSCRCELQLRGMHNVSNACSAAAVGLAAGLTLQECCEALAGSQPEQGRQQFLRSREGALVVDDAYNANSDSMKAALEMFASLDVTGRRIAVLGDMGELGDQAVHSHERVGRIAAGSRLDELVCVGDLARHIAEAAREAGMSEGAVVQVDELDAAIEEVRRGLASEDAVLVKASHFMQFERIVEGLVG